MGHNVFVAYEIFLIKISEEVYVLTGCWGDSSPAVAGLLISGFFIECRSPIIYFGIVKIFLVFLFIVFFFGL